MKSTLSAEESARLVATGKALTGVTRDQNGMLLPANLEEWRILCEAIGIPSPDAC